MKTVIYRGGLTVFNLYHPRPTSFPKNMPVSIPDELFDHLPANDFEVYNPKLHNRLKIKTNNPILVKVKSKDPLVTISAIHAIQEIQKYYPRTKIKIFCYEPLAFHLMKILKMEVVDALKPTGEKYYKTYELLIDESTTVFNRLTLSRFTLQSAIKMRFGIFDPKTDKEGTPGIIKESTLKEVFIIKEGQNKADSNPELAEYLHKHLDVKKLQVESPDKAITELLKCKYLISMGENPFAFMAASLGVPVFIFLPNDSSLFIKQLYLFNNRKPGAVTYCEYDSIKDQPKEIILSGLKKLIWSN